MSVPRNHCAGGVINGKFYVVGGRGASNSATALEVYNPSSNTWSPLAPMPTGRSGIAAAVVNNELWVFGGEDLNGGLFGVTWKSITLSVIAGVRTLHAFPAAWDLGIGFGNKVYMPGGGNHAGLAATNTNQIFTVSTRH